MEIEFKERGLFNFWCKKGQPLYWHREDGPAYICTGGDMVGKEQWWYYDIPYSGDDGTHEYKKMPLNLFLAYCKWEYKKNGS